MPSTQPRSRYDVFLSHQSGDKPQVEQLAARLEDEAKLKPFLDKWHLVPGEPWQEALEAALDDSATCAVFLGPTGLGPWENEELRAALDERVKNGKLRIIPVLLPGANPKDKATLPRFLSRYTWVDFRAGLDDSVAFHRLVAGIKGVAPGRLAGQPNSNSAEEAQTAETKLGQNPDVLVTNTKSPDQEPVVRAAHITSSRTLIGVIITAVLAAIATISAATINKCDGVIKLSPSPTPAPFIGRISDKNTEERIKGAKVSLESESVPSVAYTDSEGIFSFPVSDPSKELRLRIEANKYQNYDLRVTPAKNQGIQDVRLTPKTDETADLSGSVRDSNDRPIQGAKATLDDVLGIVVVETSSDGTFTIRNIPRKPGEMVRLRIAAEGYKPNPYTDDVVLGTTPRIIKLKRKK